MISQIKPAPIFGDSGIQRDGLSTAAFAHSERNRSLRYMGAFATQRVGIFTSAEPASAGKINRGECTKYSLAHSCLLNVLVRRTNSWCQARLSVSKEYSHVLHLRTVRSIPPSQRSCLIGLAAGTTDRRRGYALGRIASQPHPYRY
jgi:hypothetical protein